MSRNTWAFSWAPSCRVLFWPSPPAVSSQCGNRALCPRVASSWPHLVCDKLLVQLSTLQKASSLTSLCCKQLPLVVIICLTWSLRTSHFRSLLPLILCPSQHLQTVVVSDVPHLLFLYSFTDLFIFVSSRDRLPLPPSFSVFLWRCVVWVPLWESRLLQISLECCFLLVGLLLHLFQLYFT